MNYILKIFFFAVTIFVLLYSFILSVDPYDKFGFNVWKLKTKAVYSARDTKFYHINHSDNQYDLFILGSSRAQRINPERINKLYGQKTYNYSVIAAQPEDHLVITRHIIDKQSPRTIMLYLDFKNLNKHNKKTRHFKKAKLIQYFDQDSLEKEERTSWLFHKTYLTLTALTDSVRIIFRNIFSQKTQAFKINGMYNGGQGTLFAKVKLEMPYFVHYYNEYEIDNERVWYLKEVKRICDEHKIELIVAISPVSKEHLEKILEDENLRKNFFDFKRMVTSIFGETFDFNNFAVEQFDGYHWIDSVHITNEFANIIVDEIFVKKNKEDIFGYKLKNDNIEQYIQDFRERINEKN